MSKFKYGIIISLSCIVIIIAAYIYWGNTEGPTISIENTTQRISPLIPLIINITSTHSSIKSVLVITKQHGQETIVLNQPFITKQASEVIPISFKHAGLLDGQFELTITAHDSSFANFGKGNVSTNTWLLEFDSVPPQLSIRSPRPSLHKGSATIVAYTVSKPVAVTGIRINKNIFPAFQQADGTYYCFFPFPIDYSIKTFHPELFAEDLAGNKTSIPMPIYPLHRQFKVDTLTISDSFLEKKMPDFEHVVPDAVTQLERYLKVNSKIRVENEEKLIEISKKTAPTMLWTGSFKTLPRAAVKATFGDNRSYMYQNKKIDQQFHMGLDLASISNASIPAANNGIVVFTGNLGIYGNIVIVDHGLGLQTLYSHLSRIIAQEGDTVAQGDTIGYTGSSGLAGGDHLHFGMLVGGIQVNPVDWLDPKWIQHTIVSRLNGV